MTTRLLRGAAALLALLLAAGCAKATDDPEKAFRLFVDRVQVRDTAGAWELLSADTRGALTELVEQRAKASGGAIPADPREAIFGQATLARPIESVEVAEEGENRAVLVVTHPGGESQRVTMVREEGGWRLHIDLPPAVTP